MTKRQKLILLASILVFGAGGSVALATPTTGLHLLKSLITGTLAVGAGCGSDSDCDLVTIGVAPHQLITNGACEQATCCALGGCTGPGQCCNVNPGAEACESQFADGKDLCCLPTGTECQDESFFGSLYCCNNYALAALAGISNYNGGLAEACVPNAGSPSGLACGTCKEDDKTHSVGAAPKFGINPVPVTTCCSGYATNVNDALGANGPEYCCSNAGQGCGSTVNGNLAFCCGDLHDPTLNGVAPFAECTPTYHVCCLIDAANCVQDTDCCGGYCNPTMKICEPAQCK
jgi:hypothetical protein